MPQLPAYFFPPPPSQKQAQQLTYKKQDIRPPGDISEQRGESTPHTSPETLEDDEFGDDDFKDQEVMNAGEISFLYSCLVYKVLMVHSVKEMDFSHIDEFDPRSKKTKLQPSALKIKATGIKQTASDPERLKNGKWACNHKCKDKTA